MNLFKIQVDPELNLYFVKAGAFKGLIHCMCLTVRYPENFTGDCEGCGNIRVALERMINYTAKENFGLISVTGSWTFLLSDPDLLSLFPFWSPSVHLLSGMCK
jgi:hypothetical protein